MPVIPANVGKVDVRAIYDSVKQGLETAGALRAEPARQAQEDAAFALATDQANASREVLPKKTTNALATLDNDLLAEQNRRTQLRTLSGLTGAQQIVAAKNGFPLATNQNTVRLPNGDVSTEKTTVANVGGEAVPITTDSSTGPYALMPGVPSDLRAFLAGTANMTPEQRDQALLVKYGLQARPSGAAIQYKEVVGADGVTRLVAVDPRSVGAQVVGSGETYGSGVSPVVAAPPAQATVGVVAPASPAANVFASPTIGEAEAQKASADATAKLQADRQQKLPKAQASLNSMTDKTELVDKTIDEAKALVSGFSVGYGALLDRLPMTDARALKAKLETIRSNVGFDALQEMRQNSPTGGALGNVSDYEGKTLQTTIASLDTGVSPSEFIAALDRVKSVRKQALNRVNEAYQRDFNLAAQPAVVSVAQPSAPDQSIDNQFPPVINSADAYNALPKGASYLDAQGVIHVKKK